MDNNAEQRWLRRQRYALPRYVAEQAGRWVKHKSRVLEIGASFAVKRQGPGVLAASAVALELHMVVCLSGVRSGNAGRRRSDGDEIGALFPPLVWPQFEDVRGAKVAAPQNPSDQCNRRNGLDSGTAGLCEEVAERNDDNRDRDQKHEQAKIHSGCALGDALRDRLRRLVDNRGVLLPGLCGIYALVDSYVGDSACVGIDIVVNGLVNRLLEVVCNVLRGAH